MYNKEKYLNACINSVSKQDYKNIEIIIINDGSTDESEQIISNWVRKDPRIIYYKQKNKGVAFSRNKGMYLAKGDYIFFQDADDILEKDAISKMVNTVMLNTVDIVVANYIFKKGNSVVKNHELKEGKINKKELTRSQVKADLFFISGRPMSSVCNKLYRLNFIKKADIIFQDNVLAEDRLFNLMCFINEPYISIINDYTYIINLVGDSRSRSFNENYYYESIQLIHSLNKKLESRKNLNKYKELLYFSLITDLDKILDYTYEYSQKKAKELKGVLQLIKNDNVLTEILKGVYRERPFKRLNGKKLFFLRINLFTFLILFLPNAIFISIYLMYRLTISFRKKLLNYGVRFLKLNKNT